MHSLYIIVQGRNENGQLLANTKWYMYLMPQLYGFWIEIYLHA